MWAVNRFANVPVNIISRKRLSLDAADRVLEARCDQVSSGSSSNRGMGLKALVGEAGWLRLAPAIRERFGVEPGKGETWTYAGTMEKVICNWAGALVAHAGRLFGTPMAWRNGTDVPCSVRIYPDKETGIVWERNYDFGAGLTQTARTVKRSDGDGKMLECFGSRAGMTLKVFERGQALHFVSENFFITLAGWNFKLPAFLSPGTLHVTQSDEGNRKFRFKMLLNHPLLGCIAEQDGLFRQMEA